MLRAGHRTIPADVGEVYFELVPRFSRRSTIICVPSLGRTELLVGRGDRCDVRFAERCVSRNHARLILEAGRLFLEPLCSDWSLVRVDGNSISLARGREELVHGSGLSFVSTSSHFGYSVHEKIPQPPALEDAWDWARAPSAADARASGLGAFAAVGVLAKLALNRDFKSAIAVAGVIAPLVAVEISDNRGAASAARLALRNLARDNVDIEVRIATIKGPAALVELVAWGSTAIARDNAARILAARRQLLVRKLVDGKVPTELALKIAAYLARWGVS